MATVRTKKPAIKRQKKLLLALLFLSLTTIAFVFVYHHIRPNLKQAQTNQSTTRPINSISYSGANPSDNNPSESRKSSNSEPNTVTQNSTPSTPGNSQSIGAKIVSVNRTGNGFTNVHIGTLVTGTTAGTCTINATQPGESQVTVTSRVQQDVNSYDCGPTNIQLADSGAWTITLTVSNGGSQETDSTTLGAQ